MQQQQPYGSMLPSRAPSEAPGSPNSAPTYQQAVSKLDQLRQQIQASALETERMRQEAVWLRSSVPMLHPIPDGSLPGPQGTPGEALRATDPGIMPLSPADGAGDGYVHSVSTLLADGFAALDGEAQFSSPLPVPQPVPDILLASAPAQLSGPSISLLFGDGAGATSTSLSVGGQDAAGGVTSLHAFLIPPPAASLSGSSMGHGPQDAGSAGVSQLLEEWSFGMHGQGHPGLMASAHAGTPGPLLGPSAHAADPGAMLTPQWPAGDPQQEPAGGSSLAGDVPLMEFGAMRASLDVNAPSMQASLAGSPPRPDLQPGQHDGAMPGPRSQRPSSALSAAGSVAGAPQHGSEGQWLSQRLFQEHDPDHSLEQQLGVQGPAGQPQLLASRDGRTISVAAGSRRVSITSMAPSGDAHNHDQHIHVHIHEVRGAPWTCQAHLPTCAGSVDIERQCKQHGHTVCLPCL